MMKDHVAWHFRIANGNDKDGDISEMTGDAGWIVTTVVASVCEENGCFEGLVCRIQGNLLQGRRKIGARRILAFRGVDCPFFCDREARDGVSELVAGN